MYLDKIRSLCWWLIVPDVVCRNVDPMYFVFIAQVRVHDDKDVITKKEMQICKDSPSSVRSLPCVKTRYLLRL